MMARCRRKRFHYLSEANVELAAKTLGECSVFARLLKEFRERRNAGEEVCMFRDGPYLIVGPNPEEVMPG